MDLFLTVSAWIWSAVSTTEIGNLQYALSTMAQTYAAVLGILLTIGLAFTQFGDIASRFRFFFGSHGQRGQQQPMHYAQRHKILRMQTLCANVW